MNNEKIKIYSRRKNICVTTKNDFVRVQKNADFLRVFKGQLRMYFRIGYLSYLFILTDKYFYNGMVVNMGVIIAFG